MIEITGLVKRFGSFVAVRDLAFSVIKGEVLGFLGPNGAGKSTTMKMVTGFLPMTAGTIKICGLDISHQTQAAQALIGYLPEGAPAYGEMTPDGFLTFVAGVRGLRGADRERAVARAVERTELRSVLDQPIETLSKGFKRRVGLAQAILHDPPVLVMDEPTDGLDPNQKHAVRRLIMEMAPEKAIVISTHILEEVDAVCTRALIIDQGRIVADGTPAQLSARSSYHNAVTLCVPASAAAQVRADLQSLPDVSRTAERVDQSGDVTFTVFPKGDRLIIETVSALALAKTWPLKGLYAEAGRLDEVFRKLTTPDAHAVASMSAAQARRVVA